MPDQGDRGGQDVQGRQGGQETVQNTGLFARVVMTGPPREIAEPFALLGIDLAQEGLLRSDRRPILVRRERRVLAEHPFLRAFPRGGEGSRSSARSRRAVVVAGQVVREFVDLWAIASPSTARTRRGRGPAGSLFREGATHCRRGEVAVIVKRQRCAPAGRIRCGQVR